jgi:hypothetical protein
MFVELVEGFIAAEKIYEDRKTIAQLVGRWTHNLVHGTTRVAVFGAGGTGKTTLGQFLNGRLDTDQTAGPYIESLTLESVKVAGDIPALLSVVPGQARHRNVTWAELFRDLTSGRSCRIINVVSWGYHASGLEQSGHGVHRAGATDEEFRAAYFADSRNEEIAALRALVPHLSATPDKLRMITLVTKQDLWWDERQAVKRFYQSGPYEDEIAQIRQVKGAANFQHTYLSCALIEQNLRMADGFMLAPTVAGYDDPLRVDNLKKVASVIEQMIDR